MSEICSGKITRQLFNIVNSPIQPSSLLYRCTSTKKLDAK